MYRVQNLHAVGEGQAAVVERVGEGHEVHPEGVDGGPASENVERPVGDRSDRLLGTHREVRNRNIVCEPQPIREFLGELVIAEEKGQRRITEFASFQRGSGRGRERIGFMRHACNMYSYIYVYIFIIYIYIFAQ